MEAADAATDPRAVDAHSLLAGFYLDRAHNDRADPVDTKADRATGRLG